MTSVHRHQRSAEVVSVGVTAPDVSKERFGGLVIPVYLDTNALLDLLAAIEGGFSLVERLTTSESTGTSRERVGEAQFGVPRVLNLFKLNMSGRLGRTSKEDTTTSREAEVTHTYGSLLHRLRELLIIDGFLKSPDTETDLVDLHVGDFVEISGIVRPNPFTSSFRRLERMLSFMDIALAMTGPAQLGPKGQAKGSQARSSASAEAKQLKAISEFVGKLTSDVEREGTQTVLMEARALRTTAVLTIFDDYLRDRSMSECLDREFILLGKVARNLPRGSTESVDLLTASGIGGFGTELLDQLMTAFSAMSGSEGLALDTPILRVEPPVLEVVPIAIYL